MVKFLFESFQMDSMYRVWLIMYRLGIWINVNVYLFMWINTKSSIKHLIVLLQHSKQIKWDLSQPQLHLSFHTWHPESLLWSIQANLHWRFCLRLGCETCLPWRQIHSNPNLQMDKVGWSNQTIPCFLLGSSTFIPILERMFVPRMMSRLMLSLSNTSTFCWLMHLFLLNSGSLMSCIVMTSCVLRQPMRVITSLVSPSNFVITPFGKAYLLIIETFKPESKSTQKSIWLLMVPIVSAVQKVTGDSCLGNLIFGPW